MKKTNPAPVGSLALIEALLQSIVRQLADLTVPAPAPPEVDYSELNYKNLETVAKAIGISPTNIYQVVRREDFPGYKIGGRWIVPKAELAEWNAKMAKEKAEL